MPAKTTSPSSSLARAKFLASASDSNVLVSRGLRLFGNTPRWGTAKVTYQVGGIFHQTHRQRTLGANSIAAFLSRNFRGAEQIGTEGADLINLVFIPVLACSPYRRQFRMDCYS